MPFPSPVEAPAHVLQLLSQLHKISLEQEAAISQTGKVLSTNFIGDIEDRRPDGDSRSEFDNLMIDKFIALDEDKCHFLYQMILAAGATNVVEAGTNLKKRRDQLHVSLYIRYTILGAYP